MIQDIEQWGIDEILDFLSDKPYKDKVLVDLESSTIPAYYLFRDTKEGKKYYGLLVTNSKGNLEAYVGSKDNLLVVITTLFLTDEEMSPGILTGLMESLETF